MVLDLWVWFGLCRHGLSKIGLWEAAGTSTIAKPMICFLSAHQLMTMQPESVVLGSHPNIPFTKKLMTVMIELSGPMTTQMRISGSVAPRNCRRCCSSTREKSLRNLATSISTTTVAQRSSPHSSQHQPRGNHNPERQL